MLWFEQFPEFEVTGAAKNGARIVDRINEVNPDVVLLDIHQGLPENLPLIRAIRGSAASPAILLRTHTDQVNDHAIAMEADGHVGPSTQTKELGDAIRKAFNKRRMALTAANMPMTKAG